jgi:ABC-type uncharacterized transport system substrate-binding protein
VATPTAPTTLDAISTSAIIMTSAIPSTPMLPIVTQQSDIDNVSDYQTTDKLIFLASTMLSNVTQIMLYDSTVSGRGD